MYLYPYQGYRAAYSPELRQALELIKEAVQDERNDELFYDYLISVAPTQEEKDIIRSIRDDERKHNQMFRKIYKDITGTEITAATGETFQKPSSYLEGIKRALFGELKAVEKYRKIREGLPQSSMYRDMLFEIITDELKHGSKYNYIYTINSTGSMPMGMDFKPNMNMMRETPDTMQFTPDDWVRYITPLVNRGLAEAKEGINLEHLFQEFILSGVLVGLGYTPLEAIEVVERWEKTGESKLLAESKKKMM